MLKNCTTYSVFFNKSLKIPLENLLPVCYNLDVKGDEFYFYETNYR